MDIVFMLLGLMIGAAKAAAMGFGFVMGAGAAGKLLAKMLKL